MYFWIVETKPNGDVVLWPPKRQSPFNSYLQAIEYEDENMLRNTEIVELPYRNRDKAVQCLKARRVDQMSSVQKGMKKFRHPKND